MDIEHDLAKPAGKARTTLLTAALLLALGVAACSSNTDVQAADTQDTSEDTFLSAEVDSVDEEVSEPAEELPFADEGVEVEGGENDGEDSEDETPPETTPPETTTTIATTTETPDEEPVFSEFPDSTLIRVANTGGETLNVRAEPNASAEILGEFAANTWYVEATGRVADVGDDRWRQVSLASGRIGWAHEAFLEPADPGCVDITVTNILDARPWEANLDNDGLGDVVTYIRGTDGLVYIRVEYGNGAVTTAEVDDFGNAHPDDLEGVAIAEDIDGDGFDEIRFSTFKELETTHEFITMNGCDFMRHGTTFFQVFLGDDNQGWACKNFGTPDAEFFDLLLAGDGSIVRAFGNTFDPATGFTGTEELLGMTSEEMLAYFDPECTTDFS